MRASVFFLMWFLWLSLSAQVDTFMISSGLWGLDFSPEEIAQLKKTVYDRERDFEIIRQFPIDNNIAPALYFNPLPRGFEIPADRGEKIQWTLPQIDMPADKNDLAFYSILELASLIKSRKISSGDLTTFFIDRLKKYSDTLECTITITEDLAFQQAHRADSLLNAGSYLGPLHGIPYGAKDLFSVPGYPTTWGAMPYQNQVRKDTSDVIAKLEASGAVLIAKLTLGALAMGDVWYGGVTKNPWKPRSRLQWLIGRFGQCYCCRARTFCHWYGDPRFDCITFYPLWSYWSSAHLWQSIPVRCHGFKLEYGQDWSNLSKCRRLCHCL